MNGAIRVDLYGRDKLETKMRRAVLKVFKRYKSGKRRKPPWAKVRADLIEAVHPIMDSIQLQAIRAMYGRYASGPAPSSVVPQSMQRAEAMADDLIEVSNRRWVDIGPKRTDEDVADWWATNFGQPRAKLVGITETTIAHQTGEDIAWAALKASGEANLIGIWVTEPNPCQYCANMNGKDHRYWRKFYPAGPPSPHPGCRCHIVHTKVG